MAEIKTTASMVEAKLRRLEVHKASGRDRIHSVIVWPLAEIIVAPLLLQFLNILSDWRSTEMILRHK